MSKNCHVIITSIQEYTKQVYEFSAIKGWDVLVVGDRKTPSQPAHDRISFLNIAAQNLLKFKTASDMPFNHYCRKNIGYLVAISQGAKIIFDTDDDNAPLENAASIWGQLQERRGNYDEIYSNTGAPINIYRHFSDHRWLWPRGLPLECNDNLGYVSSKTGNAVQVGVWQGLVNGDPDVDAIHRLLFGVNSKFVFEDKNPVLLGKGVFTPFNSQNTMWFSEAFCFLYLPTTVSFRFTDILRGFVAQRCMWAQSLQLGYTLATAYQERNCHDYYRDFEQEISCYLGVTKVLEILRNLELGGDSVKDLRSCYSVLHKYGVVGDKELIRVENWISDLQSVGA